MIHIGDCVDVMATLPAASVDAIVTDPPYGLEFMGKEWDSIGEARWRNRSEADREWLAKEGNTLAARRRNAPVYGSASPAMQQWHQRWATEALRVAKPGAYLLAFGGTRTYHRLACAIEDAGWIIRDCLVWAYAQGFPKGRANLKPAWEPIVMARKPGPLRPLAIDATRIGVSKDVPASVPQRNRGAGGEWGYGPKSAEDGGMDPTLGRWPANVLLTDPIFDGDVDGVVGGGETAVAPNVPWTAEHADRAAFPLAQESRPFYGDTGTYSRFFLIPKSARSDREPNAYGRLVGGLEERVVNITEGHGLGPVNTSKGDGTGLRENRARANVHPTVKPVELMRHLVRLVTPVGGVVLDPFLGSGSTAIAAEQEGFAWIGIEREAEYVAIAEARLAGVQRGLAL